MAHRRPLASILRKLPRRLGISVIKIALVRNDSEDCVFTAQLLLAPALLARFVYVLFTGDANKRKAPGYDTAAETMRTIARGVAAPVLLSALAIAIGVPTGARWLTGLGVALCWPIIGYVLAAHVARTQLWKACKSKCVELLVNECGQPHPSLTVCQPRAPGTETPKNKKTTEMIL